MSDHLSYEEQCRLRDSKIVKGYIRTDTLASHQIPMDIIDLCFKYYHALPERFDMKTVDKLIKISNKGLTATATKGAGYPNVYGSVGVDSKTGGKYQWILTITKRRSDHIIGITSDREKSVKYCYYQCIDYGYQTCSDRKWNSGKYFHGYGISSIDTGGELIINVDFDLKTISFTANGDDRGIAFDDVVIGPVYYLAASLHIEKDAITIKNFKSCV